MCPQLEAPVEVSRSRSPYASAPRLPQGEGLDLRQVLGISPPGDRDGAPPGDRDGAPPGDSDGAPPGGHDAALASGLELEIGPGRGSFLLERLAIGPEVRIVGLEIRLKWASLVDQRLHELGLAERGRVFAEDIRQALPRFATGSLSRVFVHFPDPWWKKKHAKRRLANGAVVTEIARLLRSGGELFIQTDVWETAEAYREAVEAHPAFEPLGDAPGSALVVDNPYGARSPRERRVMANDLPVTRLRYRRRAVADLDPQDRVA